MNFSFVIITRDEDTNRTSKAITSIIKYISNPDIIIVHDEYTEVNGNTHYKDFTLKKSWITAKKNYGVGLAKNENVVLLHDYIELLDNFYTGYLDIGNDWNISMCRILNNDNTRYMDNLVWDDPQFGSSWTMKEKWCPDGKVVGGRPSVVPYDYNNPKFMYVPGYFWVAKTQFMLENPLDESLCHCDAEDVEFAYRTRHKWIYKFNENATVKLLKYKKPALVFI